MQVRHTFISQELLKNMKELEEKKADKQTVEREIVRGLLFHFIHRNVHPWRSLSRMLLTVTLFLLQKAERSALESKVSHLQFDSEQLGATLKELLHEVSSQEQDWRRVMDRLSTEMDCKVNVVHMLRSELGQKDG